MLAAVMNTGLYHHVRLDTRNTYFLAKHRREYLHSSETSQHSPDGYLLGHDPQGTSDELGQNNALRFKGIRAPANGGYTHGLQKALQYPPEN